MKAPDPIWMTVLSYAIVGMIIAGATAAIWECAGLFSHGYVRFGLVSAFFAVVAWALPSRKAAS